MKKGEKTNKMSADVTEVMVHRTDTDNEHIAEKRYQEAYGPIDPSKRANTWQLRERIAEAAEATSCNA